MLKKIILVLVFILLPFIASAAAPTSGFSGYWKFDESSGTTATDSSGNGRSGTLTNGPTFLGGQVNNAINFDGSNDFVSIPSFNLSGTGFTLSVWINPTTVSGSQAILAKGLSSNVEYYMLREGNHIQCGHANGGFYWLDSADIISSANQWYHVACTYNSSGNGVVTYINGNQSTTGTFGTAPATNSNALVIGNNPNYNEYFQGRVDEVRIYNRALSSSEILDVMNDSGAPATPTSPSISSFSASPISISQGNSSTLSWSVSGNPTPTLSVSGIGSVSGSSISVSPSVTTTYTLTASNSQGNTTAQTTVTVTAPPPPDTTAPSIPTNLSASVVSSSQINLSWSASTDNVGVTGYDIYRGGTLLTTVTGTSYSNTGLAASTAYSYTVRAKDAAGNNSSQSSSVSATTQASTPPPSGTTFYIRDGGTSSTCSDWTNACDSLPATLSRGATYYVADGSYPSYIFDDANSGTTLITIKKATASDHGTNTGWSSTYGDGQSSFTDMMFTTSYYTIDGQTRNESNWQDVASYGFRNTGSVYSSALNPGPNCADNLTIRYMDIGGPAIGNTYSASNPSSGFYLGGFGDVCNNWIVSRSHIHNVGIAVQGAGQDGLLVEYTWMGPSWSKEAIRGQVRFSNSTIRNNVMWNACQTDPSEGSSSGCTGEIAIWDGPAGAFDGNQIYGNLIQKTTNEPNSGGAIIVGDTNPSVGSPANNTLVYNNTIVGLKTWRSDILVSGGSGNIVRNNIWADISTDSRYWVVSPNTSNNLIVTTNSFVSYPSNIHLASATANGTSLSSPYNIDMDGRTRGSDGVWDLGAYEYSGSGTPPPTDITAPVISSVTSSSITQTGATVAWTTNENSDTQVEYGLTTGYGSVSTINSSLITSHSANISGLTAGTLYNYRVKSRDAAGNLATSANFTFTTQVSTPPPPTSTTFTAGQRVQATANLNVRATASASGTLLGTQANLAIGTIVSGGTSADGFFWWNVNFDSGVDGYSVEDYLTAYTTTPPPSGTTFYIRDGGTSSTCSDWTNACDSLPATLSRGATYYVADGSYGGYTFDDALSGTQIITVKKATIAEHGTNTGWQNTYGDGQAIFNGSFTLNKGYYIIDGSTRNESNWKDSASYGFRASSVSANSVSNGDAAHFSTIKYTDLGGTYSDTYYSGQGEAVYFVYNQHDITLSRNFLHNSTPAIAQLAGANNMTIEYNWFGPGWGKVAIRGGNFGPADNWIIRNNVFWNSTQTDPEDNTSGLTAEIAIWDYSSGFNNIAIYGNVFWSKVNGGRNGVIVVGGDEFVLGANHSWRGGGANNTKIYNNTIAGMTENPIFSAILVNGSSGNEARNNLFYDIAGGDPGVGGIQQITSTNNDYKTSNPFVNYSGLNFQLTAASAGTSLSATYNTDPLGKTRGSDGVWDIGAYEFTSTGGPDTTAPSVPASLSATAISSSAINLSWTASTDAVGVTGYRIYRNGTQVGTSATNSYSDTGLSPSTSYSYTVSAYDAAGNSSSQSSSASATTQAVVATPLKGDLNLDHIVNSLDFSLLNSRWNQNYPAYDLLIDGIINSLDFAYLSSNWLLTW